MGPIICNVLNSNYFPIVKQSLETLVFSHYQNKPCHVCIGEILKFFLINGLPTENPFFKKILVIFNCSSLCEEIFMFLWYLQLFLWRDFHVLVIFAALGVKRFSCSCDICSSLCEEIFMFLWYLQLFVWRDFHLLIVFTVC